MGRRSLLLCLLVGGPACPVAGCDRDEPSPGAGGPSSFDATSSAEVGDDGAVGLRSARRPARRYVLAHGAEHCIIYWEHGDERSEPIEVRCPREVRSGERIRLSGRVCFREGQSRERDAPVRCPTDLIAAERADRADGG